MDIAYNKPPVASEEKTGSKKRWPKWVAAGAGALSVVMSLSACGPSNNNNAPAGPTTSERGGLAPTQGNSATVQENSAPAQEGQPPADANDDVEMGEGVVVFVGTNNEAEVKKAIDAYCLKFAGEGPKKDRDFRTILGGLVFNAAYGVSAEVQNKVTKAFQEGEEMTLKNDLSTINTNLPPAKYCH